MMETLYVAQMIDADELDLSFENLPFPDRNAIS